MTSTVLAVMLVVCLAASGTSPRRHTRRVAMLRPGSHEAVAPIRQHRRRGLSELLPRGALRRPRIDPAAVAAWVDDLARSLRHGSTLHHAVVSVLPADAVVANASADLRHRLSRGASVSAASDAWHARLAADSTRRIELLATTASVISVCAMLGGPAAAPLDRLAVAMRQRASDDLERSVQSAQARISARVLTVLPVAVLVLLIATDDDVRSVIAHPTGGAVVALGIAFNIVGAIWMSRIAAS